MATRENPKTFPTKLAGLLKEKRLSQAELAEQIGVSQGLVSRWALGKNNPDIYQALALAKALKVSLDWLADDEADFPPPESLMGDLSGDEMAVLRFYRSLRPMGLLDEGSAITGISMVVSVRSRGGEIKVRGSSKISSPEEDVSRPTEVTTSLPKHTLQVGPGGELLVPEGQASEPGRSSMSSPAKEILEASRAKREGGHQGAGPRKVPSAEIITLGCVTLLPFKGNLAASLLDNDYKLNPPMGPEGDMYWIEGVHELKEPDVREAKKIIAVLAPSIWNKNAQIGPVIFPVGPLRFRTSYGDATLREGQNYLVVYRDPVRA